MNELYIRKKAVWTEPSLNESEALAALKAEFPGRSARRMTRLGMQMTHVLRSLDIQEDCSLIYASSFSETCTIEKFLDSFPFPSPQAFQTSIHPSGVEQFLIQNKQPVTELFPLAGLGDLLFRALDTALLCQNEQIILCGGEERGTWLGDTGVSAEANYAWAIEVRTQAIDDAVARIAWRGLAEADGDAKLIPNLIEALRAETVYRYRASGGGELELSWSV